MQIDVFTQDEGLRGGQEVWVKVLSNEVMDWPDVESKLDKEQHEVLASLGLRKTLSYFPHHVTEDERAEHGFLLEDWFVWSVPA